MKSRTRQHDIDMDIGLFRIALSKRTHVMGVLNVTPDSFSDGGRFFDRDKARGRAATMAADGADIIDIGGESTRPGAGEIGSAEERDRIMPVIESIADSLTIPISVDTRKAEVAQAAIEAGAGIVNDISGLRFDPEMAPLIARTGAAVILMHARGTPRQMQTFAHYDDVVSETISELRSSVEIAKRAGINEDRIIIDPGIGFAKTAEHNLEILNRLDEFNVLGRPICVGTSRKSFIGRVLGIPDPDARLVGTLATCVIAIMKGAGILRVHDVKEAVMASRMTDSVLKETVS